MPQVYDALRAHRTLRTIRNASVHNMCAYGRLHFMLLLLLLQMQQLLQRHRHPHECDA